MATIMRTIGEYKQFLMAVADNSVAHMSALVHVGLRNGSSICSIMVKVMQAAAGLYKPKDFDQKELMQAVVLYRFGGTHMVELMHKVNGMPGIRTVQASSLAFASPIEASASMPTIHEIHCNIHSAFCVHCSESEPSNIQTGLCYCNIQIDEIKVEEHPRYDVKTNQIYGLCHEHLHNAGISVEFGTEEDVKVISEAMKEKKVHLASEVCSQNHIIHV